MKKLLERLRLFLFRRRLTQCRRALTRSIELVSGFPTMKKLEENILYRREALSAAELVPGLQSPPLLLRFISRFDIRETVYGWGFACSGGWLAVLCGSSRLVFVDQRLCLAQNVNCGAIFTVTVNEVNDRVILYFDGTDGVTLKLEDAAGKEIHAFPSGRMPSWDKICLHAR